MDICDISKHDAEAFLAINNAAVPHVNQLDEEALTALLDEAFYAKQVRSQGEMTAFLVVFAPGASYQSVNYQWFSKAYDHFAYVDRIVVSQSHRGQGLGGMLYQDLFAVTREIGFPRVCCEVNLSPPNPGSSAFHADLGFVSVGTQQTENGAKQVDLLIKEFAVASI